MKFRRVGVFAAACVIALASASLARAESASDRAVGHILNRLAFGPTAADVEHVKAIGIERYIAEQLDPGMISEPPELTARLAALDTLRLDPIRLYVDYGPLRAAAGVAPSPEETKARRERARVIVQQAAAARVYRALYSPRQLEEVMVDFWFNHFNVFAAKGIDHLWVGAYEAAAIRPHALGRFRDLLLATAKHPAMLFYLDNWENSAPGSTMPDGRAVGLNENYARELMELHTLGVDGGYTQDDVVALARMLTGWGLVRRGVRPPDRTGFRFEPARHEAGPKKFLGRTIASGGEDEAAAAIDILARHPATARHIAFKLAQYFVADTPPPALVDRLTVRFRDSDGDIRAVLRVLFASREFRDSAGAKYKTPYRYVLSAVRAAGVAVDNPRPLLGAMLRLGMPLYFCQTPDGYKNTEAAWMSPEATNLRVSFATGLAAGRLPLAKPPVAKPLADPPVMPVAAGSQTPAADPVDAAALGQLLMPGLSARARATITDADPRLRAALMLGSPDFMRH